MAKKKVDPELEKKRQKRFLKAYRQIGVMTVAARAARVKINDVYRWRKDPKFKKKLDKAFDEFVDLLEHDAIQRGREKSDTLLIKVLAANRPEKYGPRIDLRQKIDLEKPVELVFSPAEVGEADVQSEETASQDTES